MSDGIIYSIDGKIIIVVAVRHYYSVSGYLINGRNPEIT